MSETFRAGFAARHAAAAELLQQAFSPVPRDFAAVAVGAATPRHFSPADRGTNPTAGWNPLDANAAPSEFLDPVATAHAAGFAEGQAAALAAATERGAVDRALLSGLAAALATSGRIDRERVARQIRDTVLLLVTKLVGEAGVSPDLLTQRVATATELLADAAESALLRLHPDDVALVEGRLPSTVFAVGDAAVARGGFVLESASTVVEDGPDLWLDQLAAAIDKVAVPSTPSC
ncbi:MAG: flagellar biosynthesis protein FliH [Sphingomonas bacterium]|uniref:FliH/SctL family protein n=1 Tax=Sphingomonas bacterium TaxID=1895847 RepID=UPI0026326F65|nr:FliH/SctL family protein [Sphingomonas bacterium]MDB5694828.1 flagellar biosynthesis protein FliH [Sphingomonas bacterium]